MILDEAPSSIDVVPREFLINHNTVLSPRQFNRAYEWSVLANSYVLRGPVGSDGIVPMSSIPSCTTFHGDKLGLVQKEKLNSSDKMLAAEDEDVVQEAGSR